MSYIVFPMSFQTFGSSINHDQVKSEPNITSTLYIFLAMLNLVLQNRTSRLLNVHAKGILGFNEIVYDYVNCKCFIAFIISL